MQALKQLYQVRLLGGLEIQSGGKIITRFRSRQTAGLFAYLAFHRETRHSREVLVDKFWPEAPDSERGRASLSVAISSLRSQLEPPGVPHGSVIIADGRHLGVNGEAVHTDIESFEALLNRAKNCSDPAEALTLYESAIKTYRGPLLTGYYDEWILGEQERLRGRYSTALFQLARNYELRGETDNAIEWYRQAIQNDEGDTGSLAQLLDLLVKSGREREAVRAYYAAEKRLTEVGDTMPRTVHHVISPLLGRHSGDTMRKHPVRRGPGRPRKLTPSPLSSAFVLSHAPNALSSSPATALNAPAPVTEETPWVSPLPLPLPLTRFFGRVEEIEQIERILSDSQTRLLTLTGPSGIGKTRIATLIAKNFQARGESVFFAQLVTHRSDALFAQALAEAVGVTLPSRASADPLEPIVRALSVRPSLLALDNFEQLADTDAPEILQRLITRVPSLTCLVTSQHRLPIPGEVALPIPPLPIPDPALREAITRGEATPTELEAKCPSVALFVDRARETLPDFHLNVRNSPVVADLVARLEGVPLAIELAASRVQIFTPRQILDSLSRCFDVLTSRRQSSLSRHRSLQASMEWSYGLLSEPVQQCFRRLSVFRGGLTAAAAASVIADETAMDHLAQLCDTSLLRPQMTDGAIRFQMLEMLRIFGGEQLPIEEKISAERLHARHFCTVAEEFRVHWNKPDESAHMEELALDLDNFRAVMAWTLANHDAEATAIGYQIAVTLIRLWRIRGMHKEGAAYLTRLLIRYVNEDEVSLSLQASVLNAAGILAMTAGEHEQAADWYRRCLSILRQLRKKKNIAGLLNNMGTLEAERGNWEEASKYCEESLALYREMGETVRVGVVLGNLGVIALRSGDTVRARRLCEESLKLARRQNNRFDIGVNLHNLAELRYEEGDMPMAEAMYCESLHLLSPYGERDFNSNSLLALAIIACRRNDRDGNKMLRVALTYRYHAELPLNLFVQKQFAQLTIRPTDYVDSVSEQAAELRLIEVIESLTGVTAPVSN